MQQQIEIDGNEAQSLEDINQLFLDSRQKLENVQNNAHLNQEYEIEQHITEQYEQDFDSVGSNSQQIKEQFLDIEEIDNCRVQPEGLDEALHQINEDILKIQCDEMEDQINDLQQRIRQHNIQIQQRPTSENIIYELESNIKQNEAILEDIKQSQVGFLQSKLGREAFALPLLLKEDENVEDKLIEEQTKVNTTIYLLNLEIAKAKREVRRNSQCLPLSEEEKTQLFVKCNRLMREIDQKKQKQESNGIRITQLDANFEDLRVKLQKIDLVNLTKQQQQYRKGKQLENIWNEMQKQKESECKRNTLATHQVQNSCSAVARNILELRKLNQTMGQKIRHLDQKNEMIEKDSDRLMADFNASRVSVQEDKMERKREGSAKHYIKLTPPHLRKQSEIRTSVSINQMPRHRGMSVQSSAIRKISESMTKDKEIIQKPQMVESNFIKPGEPSTLGQSHTDNTLTKQFKLKLPARTGVKASKKKLQISVDVNSYESFAKNAKKYDPQKLSITQRLQRIQILEREDKLQSQRLYESRHRQQHLQETNEREGNRKITEISTTDNSSATNRQKLSQNIDRIQTKQEQPSVQHLHRKCNSLQTPDQQIKTFQSSHTYFKKRIVFRQKKISQDYMKVLEARGRKILQLDNESEG